jgi:hypothetical protein
VWAARRLSRNASRKPGEWQSFYILFQGPRFDANGKKIANAKFLGSSTMASRFRKTSRSTDPTRAAMNHAEAATNPLMLQGDHGPVAFKNIYWRPLREIIAR